MALYKNQQLLIIFFIAASVLSSAITFISVPLALHILGQAKFAQISLWSLLLIFSQALDFGLSQMTLKQSSGLQTIKDKTDIIARNSAILLLIILVLTSSSLILPKPEGAIYDTIRPSEWVLLAVAVVLNIKVIFNQHMFAALDKQISYTIFQVFLSFSRFIFPILIYYIFDSYYCVLLYLIISCIITIIISDIYLGIFTTQFRSSAISIKIILNVFSGSLPLYLSASAAIILAVLDRFIGSLALKSSDYTIYFATFSLASAVNIAVLPFYRIFVGKMRYGYDSMNRKRSLRISNIQSYVCLTTVSFLILYSDYVISLAGLNFIFDANLLLILSLSLWGAANGWILATEIMMNRFSTIQAWLILSAMVVYLVYLYFQIDISLFDLSVMWIIHGIFQTFLCPIWAKKQFDPRFYMLWMSFVFLIPFLICLPIFIIPYIISFWSIEFSLLTFIILAMIAFLTIEHHALVDSRFEKLLS